MVVCMRNGQDTCTYVHFPRYVFPFPRVYERPSDCSPDSRTSHSRSRNQRLSDHKAGADLVVLAMEGRRL